MKKTLPAVFAALFLVLEFAVATPATSQYSGGAGTLDDPYRIASAEDLNDIGKYGEDWDKYFIVINDIDMEGYTIIQPIGRDSLPFVGVFDGDNHRIWNFTWRSNGINYVGLFGIVDFGGEIKNLGMEDVDINAVGGYCVGGLVGFNDGGTITNCYSTGSVWGRWYIGGLVGWNHSGTIRGCYSTSSVSIGSYNGGFVGGLIGSNSYGTITNCYSTGSVSGNWYAGGLVGWNDYGTVTNCYSAGSVWGNIYVGGLVGYSYTDSGDNIRNSFWDVETCRQSQSAGGTPKTTAEMKTKSTFTNSGWDFVDETANGTADYWRVCIDGAHYPFLSMQFVSGDLACPAGVDTFDLGVFVNRWLQSNCNEVNNFCGRADINSDQRVDLLDFATLASQWLEGG